MQATITSTNIYPDDPSKLQSFVQFSDGTTTFTKSYVFDVGTDPLSQIRADSDAYSAASDAVSTFATEVAAKVAKDPGLATISIAAEPLQTLDAGIVSP